MVLPYAHGKSFIDVVGTLNPEGSIAIKLVPEIVKLVPEIVIAQKREKCPRRRIKMISVVNMMQIFYDLINSDKCSEYGLRNGY